MNNNLQFYNYEASYFHYTRLIMNIRQAKKYGEVIVAKPVLLLALIDGIEDCVFTENRIVLNEWLEKRYGMLMRKYTRNSIFEGFSSINNPFWHLESDGFWHLHYLGTRLQKTHTPSTRWLQDNVRYASFDDDLWILLQNETMRKRLHNYIIESKLPDAHDGWISKAAEGFSLLAGLLLAVA